MLIYMPITITTLIIIAFFTSPELNKDYSSLEHIARTECAGEIQKEEYVVEDYQEGLYDESDCQMCLRDSMDDCIEVGDECVNTSECNDWVDCAGWCDETTTPACLDGCDADFVKSNKTNSDLKRCVCDHCSLKCQHAC